MGFRVTAKDVAKLSGVTPATVSYVLNDTPHQTISPETRQRVLDAVAELRYVPNVTAKNLKKRTSHCIGVVIQKNLTIFRFNQTLQGIQDALSENGYNVLLCGIDKRNNLYPEYICVYLEQQVDGIIFLSKENIGPNDEAKKAIAKFRIPFVAFDCQDKSVFYSSVDFDYEQSAYEVTHKMMSVCSGKLIYIRPSIDTIQERLREQGVHQAMTNFPDRKLMILSPQIEMSILDAGEHCGIHVSQADLDNFCNTLRDCGKEAGHLAEEGDGLLFSWEIFTRIVLPCLSYHNLLIGKLARSSAIIDDTSICAILPNYKAGRECANLILNQIQNGTIENVTILPPIDVK